MGAKRAEHQTIITGTPQQCFEALTDYDAVVAWQSSAKRCEVRRTDSSGRGKEVFWELEAQTRPISFTLTYKYEPPSWIGYGYVEGDISDSQGEYTFEDRADGTTLATLSMRLDPGVWIPDPVAKALEEQIMKRTLEDLKTHVEAG